LADWGRKREGLVIHPDVTLLAGPADQMAGIAEMPQARSLSDRFKLLGKSNNREVRRARRCDHCVSQRRVWDVDEFGVIDVDSEMNSVVAARLTKFAEVGDERRITANSVRRARAGGLTAERILAWLRDHSVTDLPAIVETMIRNWANGESTFLGKLLLLQVRTPQAQSSLASSQRFKPYLLGRISTDWFVVRAEKQSELAKLLKEMGFDTTGDFVLHAIRGDVP
jgi:hypothetical protein